MSGFLAALALSGAARAETFEFSSLSGAEIADSVTIGAAGGSGMTVNVTAFTAAGGLVSLTRISTGQSGEAPLRRIDLSRSPEGLGAGGYYSDESFAMAGSEAIFFEFSDAEGNEAFVDLSDLSKAKFTFGGDGDASIYIYDRNQNPLAHQLYRNNELTSYTIAPGAGERRVSGFYLVGGDSAGGAMVKSITLSAAEASVQTTTATAASPSPEMGGALALGAVALAGMMVARARV